MKVLIDECAPRVLKQVLIDHGYECLTVQDAGWAGKVNGELLELAEAEFDVLITLDTNLKYQQNLAERKIAFIVFRTQSNRLVHLRPHFPDCVNALRAIKSGELIYVGTVS